MSAEGDRQLRAFLNDGDTVARLTEIYDREVRLMVRELAAGISRPGAARVRELLSRIDEIMARLNPKAQTVIRNWIKRNSQAAYVLGDRTATDEIRSYLRRFGEEKQAQFGEVRDAWTVINNDSMAAIARMMAETLGTMNAQMSNYLKTVIRRTQVTFNQSQRVLEATTGGYLRGLAGQQIKDNIAAVLLGEKITPQIRRQLQDVGFRGEMFNDFERIARTELIKVGGRTFTVRQYADLVARTQLKELAKVASITRAQMNGIDHVQMTWHPMPEPDECTPFAGKVYYVGPLPRDPLGFPRFNLLPSGGDFHPNCIHRFTPWPVIMRTPEEIAKELASVNRIPKIFFGKTGNEVRKMMKAMGPAAIAGMSNRGAA